MARDSRDRRKSAAAERRRPQKKKVSILVSEGVDWIDYKDVNLLRRFMSERAKIRARRVTGNNTQQQREIARAIRVAREMGLLPYTVRQVTQRSKGGRRDRDDRGPREERAPEAPVVETQTEELPEGVTVEGAETVEVVVEAASATEEVSE
jgi:small subunit ribosomal protein S18